MTNPSPNIDQVSETLQKESAQNKIPQQQSREQLKAAADKAKLWEKQRTDNLKMDDLEKPFILNPNRKKTNFGQIYTQESPEGAKSFFVKKAGESVLAYRVDAPNSEHVVLNSSREPLIDYQIRSEYITLCMYKEFGLEVPDAQLIMIDGKIALAVPDTGALRKIEPKRIESATQKSQLQMFYLASMVVDNPQFIESIVETDNKKLTLTESVHIPKETGVSVLRHRPFTGYNLEEYANKFQLDINIPETVRQEMRQKIENVSSQRIADIVLCAGLPIAESRRVIRELLTQKEIVLGHLESVNVSDALKNTPEWDKLDILIENNFRNTPFKQLADSAEQATKILQTLHNQLQQSETTSSGVPKTEVNLETKPNDLIQLIRTIKTPDEGSQLVEELKHIEEVKTILKYKKGTMPSFLYKLKGYSKVEPEIDAGQSQYDYHLRTYIENSITQIDRTLSTLIQRESQFGLDDFASPTLKQLETIIQFFQTVNPDNVKTFVPPDKYKELGEDIERLKEKRLRFKQLCEKKSNTLVSHLSIPEGVKHILKEGFIKSSLKQKQEGDVAIVNSPAGEKQILPQLTFAVDGAAIVYGGEDPSIKKNDMVSVEIREANFAHSAGFVANYGDIVTNHMFLEMISTDGTGRKELHVYDSQHSKNSPHGTQINIDDAAIVVPNKDRENWEKFLLQTKEEGGAGKPKEWIEDHLRCYPEYVDLDTYLHFFVDGTDLGLNKPPIGAFLDLNRTVFTNESEHEDKMFEWKHI